jgi:predicted secreted protein
MGWISITAFFFLMWWVVLFAALPVGLRTQQDDNNVTLGTVASAPRGRHMLRAVLIATVIDIVVVGSVVFAVNYLGMGFDDLPQILPNFK